MQPLGGPKDAVNFHQRWVFFADFSANSWSISMIS